jgi:hypothetical protein
MTASMMRTRKREGQGPKLDELLRGDPRADEHDPDAQRGLRHQVEPRMGAACPATRS